MNNIIEHSSIDQQAKQPNVSANTNIHIDTFGVIETCFDCILFSLENNEDVAQWNLDYTIFMDMIYQTISDCENINIYKDGISLYNFIFAKLSIILFQYDIFDVSGKQIEYQIFDSICNKGLNHTQFTDIGFNLSIIPLFFPSLDVKKIYTDNYFYPLRFICLLLIENRILDVDDNKKETYKRFLKFCIDILYRIEKSIGHPSFCVHIINNTNIQIKMFIRYDQYVFNNRDIFIQYEQYINNISDWITNNTTNIIMSIDYSPNDLIIDNLI